MTTIERIAELQEYARIDGERWNEDSIADFLAFPQEIAGMEGPFIYLEDNGNLRAVWQNLRKRFGIEFLGEKRGLVLIGPGSSHQRSEVKYFNFADIPNRLTPTSFLAFVK